MIQDLMRIYYEEEQYHKTKLSRKESEKYFDAVLKKGRILVTKYQGSIVAYIESFRITKNQLQRIIMGEHFFPATEDINNGNICFIQGLWIHPSFRNTIVGIQLKMRLFYQNKDCLFFCGYHNKNGVRKFKVYRRRNGK